MKPFFTPNLENIDVFKKWVITISLGELFPMALYEAVSVFSCREGSSCLQTQMGWWVSAE